MAEHTSGGEQDPRARWRQLPPEPDKWVEETALDPGSAGYTVPNVDPTEEFLRRYGS
ncbi:hypothetical protein AB0N05_24140 [Nocardia sp. NPDC051030]|uniref:hypothetical protein n=1 Tax=Nocardia sp. NPDC051030 TaxID=3155162 RepID=UPI00343D4D9C